MSRPVADVLAEVLETLLPAILGQEEVEPGVFIGKADVRTARRYAEALAAALADATTDTAAPSYEEGYRAGMDDAAVPEIAALFADDDAAAPVDATLTDDEREALRAALAWDDVHKAPIRLSGGAWVGAADAVVPAVERIVARRVSVDRAKVEAVEALVDEWGERVEYYRGTGNYQAMAGVTRELRAALGAPTATERGGKITHG